MPPASPQKQSKYVFPVEEDLLKQVSEGRRYEFYWSKEDEPHAARTQQILDAHPEIAELSGPEWRTKWICLAVVLLQIALGIWVSDKSWTVFFLTSYIIGAVANQAMFLAVHELTHGLGSKDFFRSNLYAVMANLPIGFPYAATFRAYHKEHHIYQGVDGIDSDIATPFEANFFSNVHLNYPLHCAAKATFMFFQILFYALRPMFVRPETLKKSQKDAIYIINSVVQFGFNFLIYHFFGIMPLAYFIASTFLAGSIHPISSHFIAEHYVTSGDPRHETYSYYGPLNYLTFNVGYHREHHDFVNVPWSRLEQIRQMAPEFYPEDGEVKSWPMVLITYIFDDSVSPFSRVKREQKQATKPEAKKVD